MSIQFYIVALGYCPKCQTNAFVDPFCCILTQWCTLKQPFCGIFFSLSLFAQDLTMGTPAAPQVAPPSWGAPMVNVVCVL